MIDLSNVYLIEFALFVLTYAGVVAAFVFQRLDTAAIGRCQNGLGGKILPPCFGGLPPSPMLGGSTLFFPRQVALNTSRVFDGLNNGLGGF